MSILKILLSEIKPPDADLTQQVRELCDKIMEQEKENIKYHEILPRGASVFLSLEAPGRYETEIGFITLEREDIEKYVVVYHTLEKHRIDPYKPIPPRRRKVWVIDENKAEKILTQFAMKLKILRGE